MQTPTKAQTSEPVDRHEPSTQQNWAPSPSHSAGSSCAQSSLTQHSGLHIHRPKTHRHPATPHSPLQEHSLETQWGILSSSMKGNSHAAAELLMAQAATSAQLEDFVSNLLRQLQTKEDERAMLEAQLKRDRAEFTGQARQLTQHFATAQHKTMALQVVHEALQGDLKATKDALSASQDEVAALIKQVEEAKEKVTQEQAASQDLKQQVEAREGQLVETRQQNEEQRSIIKELRSAKSALQTQLSSMVTAERELTQHLKETHTRIQEQLSTLQSQLQSERQRRVALARRKTELQHQNVVLQSKVSALEEQLQLSREGKSDQRSEGGGGTGGAHHDTAPRRDQQVLRHPVTGTVVALRASGGSRATIRVAALRPSSKATPTPASATRKPSVPSRLTATAAVTDLGAMQPPAAQSSAGHELWQTVPEPGRKPQQEAGQKLPRLAAEVSGESMTPLSQGSTKSVPAGSAKVPSAHVTAQHRHDQRTHTHPASPASSASGHTTRTSGLTNKQLHAVRAASSILTPPSAAASGTSGPGQQPAANTPTPTSKASVVNHSIRGARQRAAGPPAAANTAAAPHADVAVAAGMSTPTSQPQPVTPTFTHQSPQHPGTDGYHTAGSHTAPRDVTVTPVSLSALSQHHPQQPMDVVQGYPVLSVHTPLMLPTAAAHLHALSQAQGSGLSGYSTPLSDLRPSPGSVTSEGLTPSGAGAGAEWWLAQAMQALSTGHSSAGTTQQQRTAHTSAQSVSVVPAPAHGQPQAQQALLAWPQHRGHPGGEPVQAGEVPLVSKSGHVPMPGPLRQLPLPDVGGPDEGVGQQQQAGSGADEQLHAAHDKGLEHQRGDSVPGDGDEETDDEGYDTQPVRDVGRPEMGTTHSTIGKQPRWPGDEDSGTSTAYSMPRQKPVGGSSDALSRVNGETWQQVQSAAQNTVAGMGAREDGAPAHEAGSSGGQHVAGEPTGHGPSWQQLMELQASLQRLQQHQPQLPLLASSMAPMPSLPLQSMRPQQPRQLSHSAVGTAAAEPSTQFADHDAGLTVPEPGGPSPGQLQVEQLLSGLKFLQQHMDSAPNQPLW